MSEGMTPERLAQLRFTANATTCEHLPVRVVSECVAEIDRLTAENMSLWETMVNTCEKLKVDYSAAAKAPGKPSDVLVEYVTAIAADNARLNKVVDQACEIIDELLGDEDRPLKTRPELAAELQRRSKA